MINTFMVLELSTAHVTDKVAQELDKIAVEGGINRDDWGYWLLINPSDVGWWLWANNEDGFDELPQCLKDCITFARDHGCRWIMFDRDVAPLNELSTYTW